MACHRAATEIASVAGVGRYSDTTMNTRIFLALVMMSSVAVAQDRPEPILTDRPDRAAMNDGDGLGTPFESQAAGISFRPPANCVQIKKAQPDEIVQYVDEKRGRTLKVTRVQLGKATPLESKPGGPGQIAQAGLIELTLDQIKSQVATAEVLRQDVIDTGKFNVGMIVLRYNASLGKRLTQEALVQASEQLYFVFNFTTSAGESGNDPLSNTVERDAVNLFRRIVDSIQLLDRGTIKEDQDHRLFRTRALLLGWTPERLKGELVGEQWLRLQRDGRDIGYTYVVEEPGSRNNNDGVVIGIRSRTVPEAGIQVDAESWLFCAFDRRYEEWQTLGVVEEGKPQKNFVSEFGTSDRIVTRVLDPSVGGVEKSDPKQPPVRQEEAYTLNVTRVMKAKAGEPVTRRLPPFYLPQALGHLLPRLVPLNEAKTYLFATYVSEQQEVMLRYIDVGRQQQVTLGGKSVQAVPVRDRLGLEGSVTVHYLSPDGKYLGSVNEDSKITILPSDAATLTRLWKDANLSRPGVVEQPPAR